MKAQQNWIIFLTAAHYRELELHFSLHDLQRSRHNLSGFTANLEIREISELSGNLKMDSFLLKNRELSGNFDLILGKLGEIKFSLEK